MPIGNTTQNDNKAYFLRIRTQDADKQPIPPQFEIQTKKEDGTYEKTHANKVAGDLVAIKIGKRKVNSPAGEIEIDDVKIVLEDTVNQEVYFLDAKPTQLTRSLYNSLLSLESGANVNISLYRTKPNATGAVYPAISVWQNDKQVKWKFEQKDVPQPEEIRNKKNEVIQRDYDEVNTFFFEKLVGLVATFKDEPPAPVVTEKPKAKAAGKGKAKGTEPAPDLDAVADDAGSGDDIPF